MGVTYATMRLFPFEPAALLSDTSLCNYRARRPRRLLPRKRGGGTGGPLRSSELRPLPGRGDRTREPPISDMTGAPEGVPHGTVDDQGRQIGWAVKPRVWRGNDPLPGWTSIIATGMIYADRGQPVSPGVRVEVRDLALFVRPRTTGQSCLLDSAAAPGGARFVENFAGDASIGKDARAESDGGESVRMAAGRNYHFWGNRVLLPPGGVGGVFVQYEARVVPDQDARPGDLARATYLGAASADYWKSQSSPPGQVGTLNEDVAIARFKRLSSRWRLFTMNTDRGTPSAPAPH